MNKETYEKLMEAITLIENTAQEMQTYDTTPGNDWDIVESRARDLREEIELLDYEAETEEEEPSNESGK